MSQDKIKGFISYLKPSKDIQNQFFSKKKDQQSFLCSVIKDNVKVIPYRNPKCLILECVYSQEDLVEKFTKDAEYNGNFRFNCQYCNTPIYLNAFLLDSNLQKVIDDSYLKNPSIKKITVFKNGKWDPVFDKSRNHLSMVDFPEEENKDSIVPNIQEFTIQDYNTLIEIYKNEWPADFQETAFIGYNMEVRFRDLYQMIFKNEVTVDTMRFLMAYMQNQNLKDRYKWKIFYIGVNMQNFDESAKTGNFQYIDGYEHALGSNYAEKWEFITLFFLDQGVWTQVIYKIKDKSATAFNYLNLERTNLIAKFLFSKIINFEPQINFLHAFEIANQNEVQFSGNLIFLFYYHLLVEKDFSNLNEITKEGVDSFKSETASLKWLLLKCTQRYIEKNNIQFRKKTPPKKEPSLQKTPSISLQKTQTVQFSSVQQKEPTPYKSISFIQQPSNNEIAINQTISKRSIRTPSQKDFIPSLNYINLQTPQQPQQPSQRNQIQQPYVPQPQNNKEDNEMVQLSRDELVNLLEKVRQNVLYEVNNPQKDLAKEYVEDINKFNVILDKLDYMQPNTPKNQSILLSGQEMYNILDKFRNDLYRKIGQDRKYGINHIDPIIEKEEAEKNQQAFQQLLWYYYQYNPLMYKQLIDEYNHRFHNQLLEKMGLSEKFSLKKMQQQIIDDQFKNHQNQNSFHPQFNLHLDKNLNNANNGSLNKSSQRLYNSLLNRQDSKDYILQSNNNNTKSILLNGLNSLNNNMSKESNLNRQNSNLFQNSYNKNQNFNNSSSFNRYNQY